MPDREPNLPTNRAFGRLFVVVFAVLSAWTWWRSSAWSVAWLGLSLATLAVTLSAPDRLAPLNRAWMRLGAALHRVVGPVVMGAIFFGLITPLGWCMRLAGRDPMARRPDPAASSYWIAREPPGPDPRTLPNQF